MVNDPTPDEIQKLILQSRNEFGLEFTPEEAKKFLIELRSESEARDRR